MFPLMAVTPRVRAVRMWSTREAGPGPELPGSSPCPPAGVRVEYALLRGWAWVVTLTQVPSRGTLALTSAWDSREVRWVVAEAPLRRPVGPRQLGCRNPRGVAQVELLLGLVV